MNNKALTFVATISILLIVFGYWYQSFLQDRIQRVINVTDCQINKTSCRVKIDDVAFLTLSILPIGIPQTQALDIDVELEGFDANRISVNFEGIEIDHNLLPYSLDKQDPYHFSGKGFLSICSLRKMHWLANIIINSDDAVLLKVSFPFETIQN
ncbi:MAG TPA: hypothetical protein EYQ04_04240 [Candidatus Thioglobus sp.]|nr:hypothetical protein [Candidatus Thioglobus sp.]